MTVAEELQQLGWVRRADIMVRYGSPRLGWKEDGTLIIGYHEYPEKVFTVEQIYKIVDDKTRDSGNGS